MIFAKNVHAKCAHRFERDASLIIIETNFRAWGEKPYWFALEERLSYKNWDLLHQIYTEGFYVSYFKFFLTFFCLRLWHQFSLMCFKMAIMIMKWSLLFWNDCFDYYRISLWCEVKLNYSFWAVFDVIISFWFIQKKFATIFVCVSIFSLVL